jgi:Tol biopolymer transport system component
MFYRGAFESANLLKVSLVTLAAMLAICFLALVETPNTAEADDSLPKNGKITFSRMEPGRSSYDIYTVNADGSSLSRLTNGIPRFPQLPAWSPDGTQIAFIGPQIWVMGADGSNLRMLTPNKLNVQGYRPSWSPDGKRLAFGRSVSDYELTDIYTVDLYGSNITNITNTPQHWEANFDSSPDGSQMCLDRHTRKRVREAGTTIRQKEGVYVMNVDASNPTRLTDSYGSECAWSPDGTKIAYAYYSERHGYERTRDVYVMNADGSGKTNLTNDRATDGQPQWSPDGTKIAFNSDKDGDYDIYTMDADGSDVAQVTKNSDAADVSPDWQPLTPKSRSLTVHQPDTGGISLLLVACALLFSGGVMLYAGLKHRM